MYYWSIILGYGGGRGLKCMYYCIISYLKGIPPQKKLSLIIVVHITVLIDTNQTKEKASKSKNINIWLVKVTRF